MAYALAEEPGVEPAPQTGTHSGSTEHASQWLSSHLPRGVS